MRRLEDAFGVIFWSEGFSQHKLMKIPFRKKVISADSQFFFWFLCLERKPKQKGDIENVSIYVSMYQLPLAGSPQSVTVDPGPSGHHFGHHFGVWNISEVKNQPPPFQARVQFSQKKVSGKKMPVLKNKFPYWFEGKNVLRCFENADTPRSSCLYTLLHPSTKRPKSYLPPGGTSVGTVVPCCRRLDFCTLETSHRTRCFNQKESWIEKGKSSEPNFHDLELKGREFSRVYFRITSEKMHASKGLLLLAVLKVL